MFYIGSTGNLKRRLLEHTQGLVKSTKNRRPLELVYKEIFETKKEAQNRERYFKDGGKAKKILTELINKRVW
ncbi:MAG: GIY-YIG nuclease family protein [Nitrosopumilaceae archaeon]